MNYLTRTLDKQYLLNISFYPISALQPRQTARYLSVLRLDNGIKLNIDSVYH